MSEIAIYRHLPPNGSTLGSEGIMKEGKFFSNLIGARTDFLHTELLAGLTRAKIAQQAATESKRERKRGKHTTRCCASCLRPHYRLEAYRVEIRTSISKSRRLKSSPSSMSDMAILQQLRKTR